jgi:hypothetical protein
MAHVNKKKLKIQSSPLSQGIWITWLKVCDGLAQEELKSREEMICQLLFGNSRIFN